MFLDFCIDGFFFKTVRNIPLKPRFANLKLNENQYFTNSSTKKVHPILIIVSLDCLTSIVLRTTVLDVNCCKLNK